MATRANSADRQERAATLPAAVSVTHTHLLAVANAAVQEIDKPVVRLLDFGCGDGVMISFLGDGLRTLNPGKRFEVFGVDLVGAPMQEPGVVEAAAARNRNITLLGPHDALPFEDGSLDLIVSNQVLEHLADLPRHMREKRRVLCAGGRAIHLFPLSSVWMEPHVHLPFAHWVPRRWADAYIRAWARLGVGSRDGRPYATHHTHFRSSRRILSAAEHVGLEADWGCSFGFYTAKLRAIAGLRPRTSLRATTMGRITMPLLKRLSSVTLILRKPH